MAITCTKSLSITVNIAGGCNSCDMQVTAESNTPDILSQMFGVLVDSPTTDDGSGLITYQGDYTTVDNYIWFGGTTTLTNISFPNLTACAQNGGASLHITDNQSLIQFDAPLLVDGGTVVSGFTIKDNPLLVAIDLSSLIMDAGKTYDFRNNALAEGDVNAILARGAASLPGFTGGSLLLQGGTNHAPTGQGIIDAAAIAGNGNIVTTN